MSKTKAPKHLTTEARALWDRLMKEYQIEDEAGLLILQTALEAFERMRGAQAVIAVEGLQVTDRFDQKKAHPLTVTERDSRAAMLAALKALNLDLEPLQERAGRPAGR